MSNNNDADPDAAAAAMNNDEPTDTVEIGPKAPDSDGEAPKESDSVSPVETIKNKLLSTEPNHSLDSDKVDNPFNPAKGGKRRIFRGVQKLGGFDGMPAALDLVIGYVEWQMVGSEETDTETDNEDTDPVEELKQ